MTLGDDLRDAYSTGQADGGHRDSRLRRHPNWLVLRGLQSENQHEERDDHGAAMAVAAT